MGRKRKGNLNQWKPIPIECPEGWTAGDFQGLVAFEELNDYEILRDESSKKARCTENSKKQTKKKKSRVINSNHFIVQKAEAIEKKNEIFANNVDMSEWEKLSVPNHLIQCLCESQMMKPTPIQQATIMPAIVEKQNIYGAAPTGSGKTLAFVIPILTHIVEEKTKAENEEARLRSIILTPTRELAVQIKRHVENLCKYNGVKVALVVGGLAIQKQQRVLLRKKPDIVVATPGRLWEIVTNESIPYLNRESLVKVKHLVIDEADRMVEKAHFKELRLIIDILNEEQYIDHAKSRQVFIFSATLTMVKQNKNKPEEKKKDDSQNLIKLLKLDKNNLKICDLTEGGIKSNPGSEQLKESIIHCLKEEKDMYLYYFIIQNPGRTLVFCNSIDCIRRLLNIFRFLKLNPLSIHSSMPQKRRLTNIEKFSSSNDSLLFATDVAARGLDIPNVNQVVHYQTPRSADTYVHRTGRTARLDNHGISLIICDPKEDAFFLRDFKRIIKKETISEYEINSKILKRIKERIRLAQICDELEHRLRKNRVEENWFRKTAEACEIILDSDQEDDQPKEDNNEKQQRKNCERKLKFYSKQLESLLKKTIIFPSFGLK